MIHSDSFPKGVALVFGGSGGVGQAICRELVANQCKVVMTYHSNREAANELIDELSSEENQIEAEQVSVDDLSSVKDLIQRLIVKHERIHSIFVAAGSDIAQSYVGDISPEQWQAAMHADADGFFNIVHTTLPHLRELGGGSYVYISSAGLLRWPTRDILSVAPKASVQALIRGVAREEGRYNIRANSVALGVIETGIFLRLKESTYDDEWERKALSTLALKRFGKPEEVANMAVFLASNKAAYTTGQLIAVDGGFGI